MTTSASLSEPLMRAFLVALLVFAFAAVALAQSLSSGTWRSDYGDTSGNAPWYICVVPNGPNFKFYATYSRIGAANSPRIFG